jgi:predicted lipoprotein
MLACAATVAACTIVYDDDKKKDAPDPRSSAGPSPQPRGFDAVAWVESVWTSRVLPHFEKDAVPLGEVLAALEVDRDAAGQKYGRRADAEGSPWSFAVKGAGSVVSVHTESRAGTMVIAVPAGSRTEQVTLQIGPVVRGTAIRDNLPFLSFGDVTNQIEFAQLSRALNDRAMAGIRPGLDALAKPGARVIFGGAMNVSASGEDSFLITPLVLARGGN